MERVGVICGQGNYPKLVLESCAKSGFYACAVLLNGFASSDDYSFINNITVNFGEIEKTLNFLHNNHVKKIVFAGRIKRPDFSSLSVDKLGLSWMARLAPYVFSGDDALLKKVIELFENEGFKIASGVEFMKDLFLPVGCFTKRTPNALDIQNIILGFKEAKQIGIADLGQSVTVIDNTIIRHENVDGTNKLIKSSAADLQSSNFAGKNPILVKASKPQQDIRIDLPVIGEDTILNLYKCGFSGVAIEAGKCIVINKKQVIELADKFEIFIVGCSEEMSDSKDFSSFCAPSQSGAIKEHSAPLKICIISAEPSGDYIGSNLMKDLKLIYTSDIEFSGVCGKCMRSEGIKEIFDISQLSLIGIAEVITKLFHVKRLMDKTVDFIKANHPDVVITIDASAFTHRVDKKIQKLGMKIPIVHYVAPPVWAWRRWRAKHLHSFIDKLLVLFPFEVGLFEKLPTVFVGHPITYDSDFDIQNYGYDLNGQDQREETSIKDHAKSMLAVDPSRRLVTILPGSRISELNKHMPILEQVIEKMMDKYDDLQFVIPTIESLYDKVQSTVNTWKYRNNILVTKTKYNKVLSMYASEIAIAASGTIVLELAKCKLPMVVIYKTSFVTYLLVKVLATTKFASLVNILAQKKVVEELLQFDCTAQNIFDKASYLMDNKDARSYQANEFDRIISYISHKCSKQAAHEILNIVHCVQ